MCWKQRCEERALCVRFSGSQAWPARKDGKEQLAGKKQAPLSGGFLNYFLSDRPWEKWIFPARRTGLRSRKVNSLALGCCYIFNAQTGLYRRECASEWASAAAVCLAERFAGDRDSLPRMHFHLTALRRGVSRWPHHSRAHKSEIMNAAHRLSTACCSARLSSVCPFDSMVSEHRHETYFSISFFHHIVLPYGLQSYIHIYKSLNCILNPCLFFCYSLWMNPN